MIQKKIKLNFKKIKPLWKSLRALKQENKNYGEIYNEYLERNKRESNKKS